MNQQTHDHLLNFSEILKDLQSDEYIVEIGAGYGETTIELLKVAKEKGTKVVVIDPFESGWGDMPNSYRYAYDIFEKKVSEYKDHLIVIKCNSLSVQAEIAISQLKIGFAYIDGLQYKGALLNDLRITEHARTICLDDVDRESETSQVQSTLRTYKTNKKLNTYQRWAFLTR